MSDYNFSPIEEVAYKLFVFIVEAEGIYQEIDDYEARREFLFDAYRECVKAVRSSRSE